MRLVDGVLMLTCAQCGCEFQRILPCGRLASYCTDLCRESAKAARYNARRKANYRALRLRGATSDEAKTGACRRMADG